MQVSDTGSAIAGALAALLQDLPNLGAIMLTAGVVTLTAAQAMLAHVADGAGSLVSLLPGHAYTVAGASLSQVAALVALAQPPASIAVTDSSATLAADLSAVQSVWAAHVNSVTVTGGVLTLTDAQADAIVAALRQSDLEALTGGQIVDVTGVPVSDLLAVGGAGGRSGPGRDAADRGAGQRAGPGAGRVGEHSGADAGSRVCAQRDVDGCGGAR